MHHSRRDFLRLGAMGGAGLLLPSMAPAVPPLPLTGHPLTDLSTQLLQDWGSALLQLQVKTPSVKGVHGGILCPGCGVIHGRCGDAIYPFLYLADRTGDRRYVEAAIALYDWMEVMVSTADGAWLNEVTVSDWKGTTVFGTTALAESLLYFGHLLPAAIKTKWTARLRKAANYVYTTFTIQTGNINYPIAASYALCLAGKLLEHAPFIEKGRELAQQSKAYFTANGLLYGEGRPTPERSAKGCYSVDLGYNVEESLPSLVQYALLMKDEELLQLVIRAMQAHAEFLLPDGGWDNSWGTRHYKWTWWGSRTSDGCHPAYGLLVERDPMFYQVVLSNTQLLRQCTHDKLLYGGPHYQQQGVLPCVAHTLAHSKALTTLLLHPPAVPRPAALLPRAKTYGSKHFPEIATWLVSKGDFRATVTAYDVEYKMKAGHPSGGALSLLWHSKAGPLLTASMSRYQLQEGLNMQRNDDPEDICLTPGFVWRSGKNIFRNILDLQGEVDVQQQADTLLFHTRARLVDEQQQPADHAICHVSYIFSEDSVTIQAKADHEDAVFSIPLIASTTETVKQIDPLQLKIRKAHAVVQVTANVPLELPRGIEGRTFNFVPGMQALPVLCKGREIRMTIKIG
ncbi:twin-arginine translocation signal domain-containing protein [Chitinophaga pendula]|uniref:twin-arginine translocation signal domain-containing protein n=1 Tax=Chitinophaga TaxID=79328 RepID=UPI000BB094B6|nr:MULTISPECIES: twin-arginine translocation signal domain-containing protein [Chitinophaga]ASZ12672.1 hypothetical protein CK934_17765 [Chitinophaga sp. MD30]UCJ09718.1 twin-arginine translocation signal domain-containing protein [Chitinophaga pendula]